MKMIPPHPLARRDGFRRASGRAPAPAAAAPAPAASTPTSGRPRIEFSEKKHNFGRIPQHRSPRDFSHLPTVGDAPLIIKRIVKSRAHAPSPRCSPRARPSLLPARKAGSRLACRRVRHGHAEVDLKVESNDPEHPTTVLYLLADVDRWSSSPTRSS